MFYMAMMIAVLAVPTYDASPFVAGALTLLSFEFFILGLVFWRDGK